VRCRDADGEPLHPPAAHCRGYPSEEEARAGCEPCCEQVVFVRGVDSVVHWGVIPLVVELDQGAGREPVRQPAGDFVASWWSEVEEQARRERECTEV
jgi:hypothetical protein